MRNSFVGFLASLAALTLAAPAGAQICAGNPNGALGLFFGGRAASNAGDTRYGAEGGVRIPGGLGVSGGVDIYNGEDGADDTTELFGRAALEMASLGLFIGPKISACPVVEARHASIDNVGSMTTVPLGFGIGAGISTLIGPSVQGYVIPELVLSHFSSDNAELDDESDTNFGFRGGAVLGFGTFFLGAEIEHLFRDQADPTFGVRAGLRL